MLTSTHPSKFQLFLLGLAVFVIATAVLVSVLSAQEIKTDAFSSAGGRASSPNFEVVWIGGQSSPPDINLSGNFREIGGFLAFNRAGMGQEVCDPVNCPGAAIFPTPADGALGDPITGFSGDTICVDIRLKENAQEIDAFGFIVQVDPNHLSFVSAEAGDLTGSFTFLDCQENPPGSGTINCGGADPTPIPPNSEGVLIRLCFEVSCDEGDTSEITISDLADDVVGFSACCNIFQCEVCRSDGDVNGDGQLTPGDALCAFQIFLNNQTLPVDCDADGFDCELIAGDVNCDGTVTPGDALEIFQRFLDGLPPEQCFAQATSAMDKSGLPAGSYRLSLQQSTAKQLHKSGEPDIVRVALVIDNAEGLDAFGLKVSYPSDKLELLSVERTAMTADWPQLEGRVNEAGMLTVGGFTDRASSISKSGELFHILFASKGKPATMAGFEFVDFVDDFMNAHVEISRTDETIAFIPTSFNLYHNFPNPFNPETRIRFDIPAVNGEKIRVRLSIYNISGQTVRGLMDEERSVGSYEVEWDGRDGDGVQVPSGMYFYSITAGDFKDTKKMLLLK